MKTKLITGSVLLFLLMSFFMSLPVSFPAKANATRMTPASYVNIKGKANGAVSALSVQDQSGTADNPAKYVSFYTPSVAYVGYRKFFLPATIQRGWINSMQVAINYKGLIKSKQTWSWSLYDWSTSRWVRIGDNASAVNNTWTLFTFTPSSAQRFVRSSNGEIRLLLRSGNATGNAKIDYEAITIDYSIPPTPTPRPTVDPNGGPTIAGCPLYPADNIWSAKIDGLPIHARSSAWINSIGAGTGFHMDFGSGTWDGGPIGIPFNVVDGSRAKVNVEFYYPDESDPGPYPNPDSLLREYGSDHHILIVDQDNCILYEIYDASKSGGVWYGGSGAIWDLYSNALRPAGWTSADAAGLPILPGLVRYDEVSSGEIKHALRFTASSTNSYIWPARHLTSGTAGTLTNTPPMGARFRLKSGYDISGFSPEVQVILQAMKTYGIILADNGSDWYVSGAPDERWNNDHLHELDILTGSDFEAVDTSGLMIDPDSGQSR